MWTPRWVRYYLFDYPLPCKVHQIDPNAIAKSRLEILFYHLIDLFDSLQPVVCWWFANIR